MIDGTSCFQLVKCVKCGSRWRELWQSHWPRREKERVEQVLTETNRQGKGTSWDRQANTLKRNNDTI